MSKETENIGLELNQLARFLFDEAANEWYASVVFQIIAGIIGVVISFLSLSDSLNLLLAIIVFSLLAWAYYLRVRFDENYDTAETMRRQAALSEGLNLPVSKTQVSEWRRRVGKKILNRFEVEPRADDYYATGERPGPKKLLEMTVESAFYTRHLYVKLKTVIWRLFLGALVLSAVILTLLPFDFINQSMAIRVAYSLYLVLPILLTIDLLFWALKLNRLVSSICEVEKDMERLAEQNNVQESDVIRLVSEYNCQVSGGIPIHNFLFARWHEGIEELWKKRHNS